jgi:Ca-activated chloride channel family protein
MSIRWPQVLAIAGWLLVSAVAAHPASRGYSGKTLDFALRDLQQQGVNIIFSSDLVDDSMVVEKEPRATSLDELLNRLLGPHGLAAEIGPGGSVLVVRRGADPILVWITSPSPDQAVFGTTRFAAEITSKEEIDRVEFLVNDSVVGSRGRPPYFVEVDLGEMNIDRQFTVIAYGAWGGVGVSTTKVSSLEINENLEIALRQLYVTVERDGRRLQDLSRDKFSVFDKGKQRELVTFERGDVPISAVLLLDASESMKGAALEAAVDGSRSFLSQMSSLDRSMMILFSDRTLNATRFTNKQEELLVGLRGTVASGGTALNDYLYTGLRLLDHVHGRRVVILLSDGVDVLSTLRMKDVLWKVRRSDALIYWLRHEDSRSGNFSSSWRDFEANEREREGLERAIKESGGRILTLSGIDQIESAFEEIMSELRAQYVLGYYPDRRERDGSWRPVKVTVDVPRTRVRFRAGYVDH